MTLADARPDPVSSRPPGSPWARPYGAVTAGAVGLSFLFAFEALAVATVMPAVARELDGLALDPVAFAAPLAAAVVALVVAGPLADRHGPSPVLHGGLVVFATGVVLAGVAWSMPVFLLGRLVHGAGGGVIGVALVTLGAGGAVLAGTSAVPLAVPVVGWAVAGLGIGMAYSTLSVLALACATDGEAGATSSALQLNDHLVISAVLALGGVAFAGFASGAPVLGATLLVAAAAAVGMLAQVPARRLRAPGATA